MKLRQFIGALVLCGLMAITASAQQDPADQGAPDSVFMEISQPSGSNVAGLAEASLYFFHDVQNVGNASVGFSWDNPNWVMDSAVWAPEALAAFNLVNIVYFRNSVDSTNFYRKFQFTGLRMFGDGLPVATDPQQVITYYFHRLDASLNDSLCVSLDGFVSLAFVDLANIEYEPVWRGTVCNLGPEPPDTTRVIIENPLNGHTYEFVKLRGEISWHDARLDAEGHGGYLATITDSIEADIVRRLLAYPGDEAWLGGTDEAQEGVWAWITGEPWAYTNWYPGEPNASQPHEDYLLAQHVLGGRWVDVFDNNTGYIVERNNTQPLDTLISLIQWPVNVGGNGHWYAVIPEYMSWFMADSMAGSFEIDGHRGHLASVGSAEENGFITSHVLLRSIPDMIIAMKPEFWLGGFMTIAGWHWTTGEPFDYFNWADSIGGGYADYAALAMVGFGSDMNPPLPGEWVSRLPECGFGGYPPCKWAVVEFDVEDEPPEPLVNLREWPVSEGGNGHWYAVIPQQMSWSVADDMAGSFEISNVPGHLATVSSAEENQFIAQQILPGVMPDTVFAVRTEFWMGGFMTIAGWNWVTGEPFDYQNWADDPGGGWPDYAALAMVGHGWDINPPFPGQWVSRLPECGYGGYHCRWAVVEFDLQAEPIDPLVNLMQWPISEGGNGHWYAVIPQRQGWYQADSISGRFVHEGIEGHLATVTSEMENQFIAEHILPGSIPDSILMLHPEFWLGAIAYDNWHWVTDEPWDYTNWIGAGPPWLDSALALAMIGYSFCETPPVYGKWTAWNPYCDVELANCKWAVVEFDADSPEPPLVNLTYWPVSEGGNGHWYALMVAQGSWSEANRMAGTIVRDGKPGHLTTVTSSEENQFVLTNLMHLGWDDTTVYDPPNVWIPRAWMGGYQTNSGAWHWVTDEPFDYTNWGFGQPLDSTPEFVLAMQGGPGYTIPENPMPGQWISVSPYCDMLCPECCMAIVEFDTGPMQPPRTLLVPQEYPSIQLAISASRHGDRVLVAPGTYHESLNFLGRAITVKSTGGPLVTTITNERTANLVTFDHGEGPRARLDGFTLRGGWMAVLCVGSGPTISHNICVRQNIWNWSAIGLAGELIEVGDPTGDPRYSAVIGPAPAVLVNNTIVHSANGGISSFSSISPTIRNNIVAFNAHYGIHQQHVSGQPQPIIGYNDVYHNDTEPGGNAHGDYINIPDPGPGAISADPMFMDNFTLAQASPCVDAGDPQPRFNDPDGSRNDMGAVPLHQEPGGVTPTNEWIVVYCSGYQIGFPMGPNDLIRAFDPDGVLCGQAWRDFVDGPFGFMPVYRDDPYTDIDEGAEPGDLITFSINGEMVQSTPLVYWTANGDVFEVCDFSAGECLDISLHVGWNLISWNVDFHDDIYTALGSIMGCLDVVHSFEEGALTFDPGLDAFNTLTHVDPHHGYWVRVTCDATLQVCGDPLQPWEAIYCEPGWNLVSYWPPEPAPVEDALYSLMSNLQQVMGFDQAAQVWLANMGSFNTLTEMRPTFGYWAKVDTWLPLVYPGFFPMDCTSAEIVVRDRDDMATSGGIEASRTWMSVYGDKITLDGHSLSDGVRFEFKMGKALCGDGVYTDGKLKLTPIYGYDPSGEVSMLYPEENDGLSVFVDGRQVYPNLSWSGDGARVRLAGLTTDARGLPQTFALKQNYPNPFNPSTHVAFELPIDGHVNLSIYNVLGQKVRTVTDQHYAAGRWEVEWNGTDDNGDRVATGIYFYRLTADDQVRTRKMMLLK